MLLGHSLEILTSDAANLVAKRLPIIRRTLCPLIVDKHPQHLRPALKLPRKGLDEVLLGRLELILGDQFVTYLPNLLHDDLRSQRHRQILALEAGPKITWIGNSGRQRRTHRVSQSLVAAHLLHQTAGEATRPQNFVEQQKRNGVGIVPGNRAAAHHHLALRNILRHVVKARLKHGRWGNRAGNHLASLPARQGLRELLEHLLLRKVSRD